MGNGPRVGMQKAVYDAGFPGYFHQILTIIVDNRDERSTPPGGTEKLGGPFPAPRRRLPGFPNAEPVRPKTPRTGGAGLRRRWRDQQAGRIYEWDSQHGTVEVYDNQGRHVGEFDPFSGERLKGPDPSRRVEP
jgi:hypothetical protein